jgi:CBS domain-containing protein
MFTLGDLCRREVYSVRTDQTVLEASRYMAERNIGAVGVMDGDRLVGILSERDVLKRVVARGVDPAKTPLSQVMTVSPVTVDISESIEHSLQVMRDVGCRHLPVLNAGRFSGMLSLRDVLEADLEQITDEVRQMRAYIQGSST